MEEKEAYIPTPVDEALYLTLLTPQVISRIQQEYGAGNFADLDTYNRLYETARKADIQARKLLKILEEIEQHG